MIQKSFIYFLTFFAFANPGIAAEVPEAVKQKIAAVEAKRQKYYQRERQLFTSDTASQAQVTFSHTVEMESETKPTKEDQLNQIDKQLFHLFGPLGENEEGKIAAVPRGDYDIDRANLKVARHPDKENTWVISYDYSGVLLIEREGNRKVRITLPNNPDTIYDEATVIRKGKKRYPCTDHHYNTVDDFWYFWNPEMKGCRLKEGVNYAILKDVKIEKIENTKRSFPNYRGLANSEGVIKISVLMGMDEPTMTKKSRNPNTSDDINATTYLKLRESLLDVGFEPVGKPWTVEEIQQIANISEEDMVIPPYVETFTKTGEKLVSVGKREVPVRMEVVLYFGASGIGEMDEGAATFHYFYKDALENSAVVVYDGHSGLGGHLDLASIEETHNFKIQIPKKKHQIFFFNSCSSYTYYNLSYLERKGGAEYIDIMVNGLATAFDVLHNTNMELIQAIDLWAGNRAPRSYQAIAKSNDSGNLFAVNGDDVGNPKTPEEAR